MHISPPSKHFREVTERVRLGARDFVAVEGRNGVRRLPILLQPHLFTDEIREFLLTYNNTEVLMRIHSIVHHADVVYVKVSRDKPSSKSARTVLHLSRRSRIPV
jgi:hypothetical protein